MKNKIYKYDFLIIGGGLIGCLLAIALFKKKYKVLVIEKELKIPNDSRTLAVNANSRDFLIKLNLWNKLRSFEEPIDKIIIEDYLNQKKLTFNSEAEPMGNVIFNSDLLIHARKYLKKYKILLLGVDYKKLELKPNISVSIKKQFYQFKKVVLCLGKNHVNNQLIKKLNFKTFHKSYVGFFNHTKNHNQFAYEIFTPNGPLAVLPAPSKKKTLSTFIYSSKFEISDKDLLKLIKNKFNQSHGKIAFTSSIANFPIIPHLSLPSIPDYVLIGDALRSIHPVAGQGWNLGIKDIQIFCDLLEEHSINSQILERIFLSKRLPTNVSYLAFTNILNELYENKSIISKTVVKLGFSVLQNSSFLRNIFIKQAMGRLNLV